MSNPLLRVAIIGGGASGVAAATHLAETVDPHMDLRVDIFDPGGTLGRGIAYSTTDEQHLLNVPAKGMSLFRDDMGHFQRWAGARPDEFVSRARYGEYLQASVRAAWRGRHGKLGHLRAEVVDVVAGPSARWHVLDDRGGTHTADVVILATGHQSPAPPEQMPDDVVSARGFFVDPWGRQALAGLLPGEHVLCLGTGLTFVDVALSALRTAGVTVTGVSRSGRLPTRHLNPLPCPQPPDSVPTTLDEAVRHVRDSGAQWRSAVDGLRAHTPAIWQALSTADQQRFMRDHARDWDVHRHRMAPTVSDTLYEARQTGRLEVIAAPKYKVDFLGHRFVLGTADRAMVVDRVIVCTGPRADVRLTPLGASLVRRGIAAPGPFAIGYDVAPATGELVGVYGTADNLFAIGPLRRGVEFESTAMPEVSAQAQALGRVIAQRFPALVGV